MKAWSLLLCMGLAQAAPCEVAALQGQAQRGGEALRVGSAVEVGDELRTAAASRLRLACRDGSTLVLAAETTLRVEIYELGTAARADARFQLLRGLIGQKVSAGGGWQVRTPSAVTAVRGTEYLVELLPDGSTAVLMQSGQVQVQPLKAQARGLVAALPLVALAGLQGTDCRAGRCSAAAPWSAERVRDTQQRLAF
jgi:hypothetical protein